MQFLFPAFLIALLTLAIPVIIHLFYFRRYKKVYFTNIRFLKEVKEETSARSRLRNLLVLLMRCLAIAFLVLAFAQPFIPLKNEVVQGRKAVSIFVDNSFSMGALSEEVPLLDLAKQRAREIVAAYAPDDQFQILTHDLEGRHQRLVSQEDALGLIEEITLSPNVRELSTILERQQQTLQLDEEANPVAFQISDFQKNIVDFSSRPDSVLQVNLVPLQAVRQQNISIDSAWFESPVPLLGQPNPLVVKVVNHSTEPAENIRLSLYFDEQVKPVGTLEVPGKSSVLDTVNLNIQRTGWSEAKLKITDYPVQFDDEYHFAFEVADKIKTLVINGTQPNPYLERALSSLPSFELLSLSVNQLDYSRLPDFQLIILHELPSISSGLAFELKQFAQNGGNILFFPAANTAVSAYNNFLDELPANRLNTWEPVVRQVGQVNTQEFVFRDVFENVNANLKLPATQANYTLSRLGSRAEEALLTYRDGSTFLGKYAIGSGHFYLCAAPLGRSLNDLTTNGEIFIPMLYKMAISSTRTPQIAYTIGVDETVVADMQPQDADQVFQMVGPSGEFIPEQRMQGSKIYLGVHSQIDQSGIYQLQREEESLFRYAFNYDRRESNLELIARSDLQKQTEDWATVIETDVRADFSAVVGEQNRGVVLWRWCLILALVFLLVEVLLLRFWKT